VYLEPADHEHKPVASRLRLVSQAAMSSHSIFSKDVDQGVRHMGLHLINTPVRTPVMNSICERVIGTMRRACLDFLIPLNERHLYGILKE
jgi:hypothetical protein